MSTILLKDNIYGVRVPQLQLSYICNTTHPSYKMLADLCHEVHCVWWINQELELQEWEDFIKSNKTIILAIIMLVPNNNPQGYKQHVVYFISFAFGEGVNIIY